jgi:hypothetical protein
LLLQGYGQPLWDTYQRVILVGVTNVDKDRSMWPEKGNPAIDGLNKSPYVCIYGFFLTKLQGVIVIPFFPVWRGRYNNIRTLGRDSLKMACVALKNLRGGWKMPIE